LNFTSKDAVFHGLSESSPIFLGHWYDSALPAKVLKKFAVENHEIFLYLDFFITKVGLYWEAHI